MKLTVHQIDAFTDKIFAGNPAAICFLDYWINPELMQQIANENNLAETAFVVKREHAYEIRWFTPFTEVDLCGHATLAAAYVLYNHYGVTDKKIEFDSPRSGMLSVEQGKDGLLLLNFPADEIIPIQPLHPLNQAVGKAPVKTLKGKTDFLLVYENQSDIADLTPDLKLLAQIDCRGIIVSAPGTQVDFVSRFFAPQSGIDEDPVTGSAHTTLIPFWAKQLDKKVLRAKQLSSRGGDLFCEHLGDRVIIGGKAAPYMTGEINIEI